MLPEFEFYRPMNVAEALEVLAEGGAEVLPVAGGTNVIPDLRAGRARPRALLDVSGLQVLRGIREENGQVLLGSATTVTDLLQSPLLPGLAPGLCQAAASFANPLVRNRATVGGNLVDASPAADLAPPLLALDAQVELWSLAGPEDVRCLPLQDFLVGVRRTQRRPHELLVAIRVPSRNAGASAFCKLGLRKSDAISVLSVAVNVACDPEGRCTMARIALGAVAPRPVRATAAEKFLLGQPLVAEVIAEAAFLAAHDTRPIDDIRGSARYRRQVTETVTRRLLARAGLAAAGRSGGAA